MRLALAFLPLALIAAAGPSHDRPLDARDQAGLDKALAGLVPGKPTSCVPSYSRNLGTEAYGRVLLYRDGRSTVFRNDTAGGCEGVARGDILVSVEYEGRPCAGDIIRTVDSSTRFQTGSCALNQFVPYSRPADARAR